MRYDGGVWEPSKKRPSRLLNAHAAVNGYAGDIFAAAKLLPEHIIEGHKEIKERFQKPGALYTLFYSPHNGVIMDGWVSMRDRMELGGGTETAQQLAAAIELAHREGREVKWTVHSSGAPVFTRALSLLNARGVNVGEKQSVFFSNPTSSINKADKLRRDVGMKEAAGGLYNLNPYSVRQNITGLNLVSQVRLATRRKKLGEIGRHRHAEIKTNAWRQGAKWAGLSAGPSGALISAAFTGNYIALGSALMGLWAFKEEAYAFATNLYKEMDQVYYKGRGDYLDKVEALRTRA